MSTTIRWIVAIDIPRQGTLARTYGLLYEALGKLPKDFDWESTDEVYADDALTEEEVDAARLEFLNERTEEF